MLDRLGSLAISSALLVGCGGARTAADSPAPDSPPVPAPEAAGPASATPAPAGSDVLIGVVQRAGVRVCTDAGESWIGLRWDIGSVPVVADDGSPLAQAMAGLHGQPVIARGRVTTAPPPTTDERPAESVPCPVAQMRSDWQPSPDGMRILREGGAALAGFTAREVSRWDGLAVALDGEELIVELDNTLPTDLTGVVVAVHYEGCYGKPGTTSRTHRVEGLAAGADVAARFPAFVVSERVRGRRGPTARHRAYSVQVIAAGDGIHFDLDAPLPALGVELTCPRD